MHPALKGFLAKRLPLAGVAGITVRMEDGSFLHRDRADWLSASKAQAAVERMAAAVQDSLVSRQPPTRLRWEFEKMSLLFVLHASGVCVAIFVPRDPSMSFAQITSFLEDFEHLDLSTELLD